jgi:hypothetical protein
MTLDKLRRQGVRHLIAYCLNQSCRDSALIDVSDYPADTEGPPARSGAPNAARVAVASTCGRTGKEKPGMPDQRGGHRRGRIEYSNSPPIRCLNRTTSMLQKRSPVSQNDA